jgi:hypothetical protein
VNEFGGCPDAADAGACDNGRPGEALSPVECLALFLFDGISH